MKISSPTYNGNATTNRDIARAHRAQHAHRSGASSGVPGSDPAREKRAAANGHPFGDNATKEG